MLTEFLDGGTRLGGPQNIKRIMTLKLSDEFVGQNLNLHKCLYLRSKKGSVE